MEKTLFVLAVFCLFIVTATGPAAASAGGDGPVTMVLPERGMYSIGDKLIFSGSNTDSDTTYLFVTGPDLDTDGAQIQSTHPLSSPVIDNDASTFQAAITSRGNNWLWTWDTANVLIDGTYTVYAVSKPRDLSHINETHYARVALIIMKPANNLTTTGAGSLGGKPAYAGMSPVDATVTITRPASGMHLHTLGGILTFSGTNTASGTTYLFITGPDPAKGLQIQSTHPLDSPVIDGDASTFLATGVGTDNRWSYTWNTRDVTLDTGTYVVYAAGTPRDVPYISSTRYAKVAVIMMRPENMNSSDSNLSVPSVVMHGAGTTDPGTGKGNSAITVSGIAKDTSAYPGVAIWILCAPGPGTAGSAEQYSIPPDHATGYYSMSYGSDCMEEGNYHVVVQHPGQNNILDIYLSGNSTAGTKDGDLWVWKRTIQQYGEGKGTEIFKVSGPGSLQGDDAYEALVQAFNDPGVDDRIAIAPLPAITSAGSDRTSPVVNNPKEEAPAHPREGYPDAVQAAGSLFKVDTIVVDPAGDLASGTPVTVSFRVNFSETGNETFPSADELQMSTGLENPRWDHTLVLDGVENPRPDSTGRILSVSGWLLSYPPSNSEWLNVTLSGMAPHVPSPASVTVLNVTEIDSGGTPIAGPGFTLAVRNNPEPDQPVRSGAGIQANPAPPVTAGVTMIRKLPGNVADGCAMIPRTGSDIHTTIGFSWSDISVFTPESAGNYSSSFTKTGAVITKEQAENITRSAFPDYSPDRIGMEYSDGGVNSRIWRFDMRKDDRQLVLGTLDAYTGDLTDYNVVSSRFWNGMPEIPHIAATSLDSAQLIAENEIRERNGELPLELVDSRIDHDGNYLFNYRRVIQGVPCYKDGIIITVDSGTGKVLGYSKAWYTPENAVAAQPVPAISREAAIALVEREARACYPESADNFRIVSADLRWMDLYNQEKFIPAPGVIPLVWYVQFDDATIRAWEFPVPEEGWIDAQNGTLRSMAYFHCRSNCG